MQKDSKRERLRKALARERLGLGLPGDSDLYRVRRTVPDEEAESSLDSGEEGKKDGTGDASPAVLVPRVPPKTSTQGLRTASREWAQHPGSAGTDGNPGGTILLGTRLTPVEARKPGVSRYSEAGFEPASPGVRMCNTDQQLDDAEGTTREEELTAHMKADEVMQTQREAARMARLELGLPPVAEVTQPGVGKPDKIGSGCGTRPPLLRVRLVEVGRPSLGFVPAPLHRVSRLGPDQGLTFRVEGLEKGVITFFVA